MNMMDFYTYSLAPTATESSLLLYLLLYGFAEWHLSPPMSSFVQSIFSNLISNSLDDYTSEENEQCPFKNIA